MSESVKRFYHVPLVSAPVGEAGDMAPGVPEGVCWVGSICGCGRYLVLADRPLGSPAEPVDIQALPGCCVAVGPGTLASWAVGA